MFAPCNYIDYVYLVLTTGKPMLKIGLNRNYIVFLWGVKSARVIKIIPIIISSANYLSENTNQNKFHT